MAKAKRNGLGSLSIPQLLDGLKKAEEEAARYRVELERQRDVLDAAIGGGSAQRARSTGTATSSAGRRRKGRKLVDDSKVVSALKSHGKAGIASSALAKGFGLTGSQMSAVLQRLAGAKKAKSNGKRGRGGRWWAV